MIRPIDINLNAAHPELPLVEATTFTGSPSSVFIRGVPKNCGNWSITAVNVAVTYPDNSTTTRAAVESAEGVWVATIPGTATSGRTVAGFRITADGIDENGAAVTGYVLGFADFSVFSFFPVPAPGETFFYLRYFDAMPTTAKKMDVTTIDGVLKYYNGTAWLPFTDLSNYYTKAETDNAIERVAAYYITYNAAGAAFPTRADLLNATTYYSGGVVRVPTRNDYAVVLADETHDGAEWRYIYTVADGQTTGQWEPQYPVEGVIAYDDTVTRTSGNGVKSSGIWSAIWGALAALPTGFSSLYDWCVAQFAKYLPLTGGTMTGCLILPSGIFHPDSFTSEGYLRFGNDAAAVDLCSEGYISNGGDLLVRWPSVVSGGTFTFALAAPNPTSGNLVAMDANGNPTDSQIPATDVALKGNIPYSLGDPIIIESDAVQTDTTDPDNPITYAEITLADRTANIVQIYTAIDELRVILPAATNGKVRDLGLTIGVGNVAAPALVVFSAGTEDIITLCNPDGAMPELADGTEMANSITLLYFSEFDQGVFLAKGEQVQPITE